MTDAIFWSALTLLVSGRVLNLAGRRLPAHWIMPIFLVLLALWQLPFALPLMRGVFGHLSVTSAMWLLALAWRGTGRRWMTAPECKALVLYSLMMASLFYPAALGFGPMDPYAWGYDGLALPLTVGILALMAWLMRWTWSALTLVLALAYWRTGLMASSNLWDALVDPLLVLGVLCFWTGKLWRTSAPRMKMR